ncbi:MAG TPA: fibrobacter succinogenes major paralogous domain-containing protein, partial [Fibrobacteria bacterium]|nr:fibrobacter succinogenes major paralogous domain-containing protein [Fibrobacteria bacterium]
AIPQGGAGIVVQDQTVSATALPTGSFSLGRIQPGSVQVFAVVPGQGYAGFDTSLQPSDTLKGVKLRISHQGGTVQGQVVVVNGGAARGLGSAARRSVASDSVGVSGVSVSAFGGLLNSITDANGGFSLPNIPGTGPVVLHISDPSGTRTQTVTGVVSREGRVLDVGNLWLNSTAGLSDSTVRSHIALARWNDTAVNLLAWTGNDTGLHVARWAWNLSSGGDTTPVGRANLSKSNPMFNAQWTSGAPFQVKAWALFVDSAHGVLKASAPGIITVKVLPPPDTIPPAIQGRSPSRDTTCLWADSIQTVRWTVTDAGGLDSVALGGFPATPGANGVVSRAETLSVSAPLVVRLYARDTSGNVSIDSVVLTRAARPAAIARQSPLSDTSVPFMDSSIAVSWTVTPNLKISSVLVDGANAAVAKGTTYSWNAKLSVGRNVERLVATDTAGNTSVDSLVLTRRDTTGPTVVARSPSRDTTYQWADSALVLRWAVDSAGAPDSVWWNDTLVTLLRGLVSRADTLFVGADTVRLRVKNAPGKTTIDTLVLVRSPYSIPWNSQIATYGTLNDARDGKVYRTDTIGKQVWMAENLDYAADSSWCPANSPDSCATYGRLYDWTGAAALPTTFADSQHTPIGTAVQLTGVCPSGWHLPSQAEWSTLLMTASDSSLKSRLGWAKNGNSGDSWGFRGLPAASRDTAGAFSAVGLEGVFWTSTETSATQADVAGLVYNSAQATTSASGKKNAFSVRCLSN